MKYLLSLSLPMDEKVLEEAIRRALSKRIPAIVKVVELEDLNIDISESPKMAKVV